MGQWYSRQLHLQYYHAWWVVLYLKCVTGILFNPKKHFKIGCCSKLHIHLKREISHETRLPEINPTTKHMLCDIVSRQYRWVQLQTLTKMTSSPGPSCSQTWSNEVLQVPLIVSAWTCVVIIQWKWQPQHITVWDTGRLLRGESFIFLYINTLFPTLKELLYTDMTSQIVAEMVSSSDLCCLYASKHLLPNSPQWTNYSQLSFPSLHNTLL